MVISFLIYLFSITGTLAALIVCGAFLVDRTIRSRGYRGPKSDHFDGTRFLNIRNAPREQRAGLGAVLRWMLSRQKNEWQARAVEQVKPAARIEGSELVATLINHASVLIQTEGLNIITDPIYANRASPFTFAGPKRYAEPGIAFEDLPHIDAVLISHNHYDHLDLQTLRRLAARENPPIFAALGTKEFLEQHGMKHTVELDWWQAHALTPEVSVTCVPAQHFSARGLSDRDRTLWCGYAITTPNGSIYFAGDTGYGPFVAQIAKRFPAGFRLGLLPIGAFKPEWFMKEVHISPDEAFAIQQELKIENVLAIHFGTFKLADDKQDEPATRVQELTQTLTGSRTFRALPNGGSLRLPR